MNEVLVSMLADVEREIARLTTLSHRRTRRARLVRVALMLRDEIEHGE